MKINIKQINIKYISVSHQNISQRRFYFVNTMYQQRALVDGSGMSRYTAKVCSPKSSDLDVRAIERNAVIRQMNAIHASMHINVLKKIR